MKTQIIRIDKEKFLTAMRGEDVFTMDVVRELLGQATVEENSSITIRCDRCKTFLSKDEHTCEDLKEPNPDVMNCLETHIECSGYCGRKKPTKECNHNFIRVIKGKPWLDIKCQKCSYPRHGDKPTKAPLPEKLDSNTSNFWDIVLQYNRLVDYLKEKMLQRENNIIFRTSPLREKIKT